MTDFDYYKRIYGGNTITEDEYAAVADRASAYIKLRTFGRQPRTNDADIVKKCECELAEIYYVYDKTAGKKSYTTDGESVTYDISSSAIERQIADTVERRLALTGLLYCGGGIACW